MNLRNIMLGERKQVGKLYIQHFFTQSSGTKLINILLKIHQLYKTIMKRKKMINSKENTGCPAPVGRGI